ncbi:MAG: ribonuclease [Deltaproteobacteria bacterium]|nr:MAG: ribonuclease [Deltaproteobacteria bacterium]
MKAVSSTRSKILINALETDECRIAKITDSKLVDYHLESATNIITQGNIYKAKVTRVEPSLQAVFVDYGAEKNGFLQKQEIHSDFFQDSQSGDRSLQMLIKRGQELVVQVTKDPFMHKGAMLTTFISLPGRYVVLMPGSNNRGVSRQIENEKERSRLKEIIDSLNIPSEFGIIVRTAGDGCTKTDLSKDYKYLMRLWKQITKLAAQAPVPELIYKEQNLAVRAVRDYLSTDVNEILIDDEAIFKEVKQFVSVIAPKQTAIVKRHRADKPIFNRYQLEQQISSIYETNVDLKSGGSIVINPTEALVSIDVNSGKATQRGSFEETALQTNMEAAEQVARQLRLRDLGGLIVIDFIDMRDSKNKIQVERTLKKHLKVDKARTKVGRISQFGLLEMSRQRIRPSIDFGSFTECPHCKGKGRILSSETLGNRFLRELFMRTRKAEVKQIRCSLPPDVAAYLLNRKRAELLAMETKNGVAILIETDADLLPGSSCIHTEE